MCGLIGGISNVLTASEIKAIEFLAVLSQLRGTDSTGMAVVFTKKKQKKVKFIVHKELGNSSSFLEKKEVREILRKPNISAVLGHTRFTTSGSININNAHPIVEQHITGCHNGVVRGLEKKTDDPDKMTDSRRLFALIAEKGLQGAVDEAGSGSIALSYVDKKTRTVNLFRNWARDLYLTSDSVGTTWLWASEAEMLEFVMTREKLRNWKKPWLVPAYTLLTWNIGSTQYKETKIKPYSSSSSVIYPISRPYVSRIDGSASYASCTVDPWAEDYYDTGRSRESAWDDYDKTYCQVCWSLLQECSCAENGTASLRYEFYGGCTVSVDIAERWLDAGCFGCKSKKTIHDKVVWPHYDYYLCDDCSSLEFYREYLSSTTRYEGCLVRK